MNDGVMAEALRARDPDALAALYDRYAEPIYQYCCALLGDPDSAQVALRDTFIAAEALIGSLADPAMFRPWLYALARGESLRRRVPGGRAADDTTGADGTVQPPAAGDGPAGPPTQEAGEVIDLQAVARSAVAALSPENREILELTTRHGLSLEDVAHMLGTGRRHVEGWHEAAAGQLRDLITVELLARSPSPECEAVAGILGETRGGLTPQLRARLVKHLARCEACSRHRMRQVSPEKVFTLVPPVRLPETLRVRVLSCFADPELVPYRRYVARRVGPLDPSGFPKKGTKREGRVAQAISGAISTVAAVVAVVLLFAQLTADSPSPTVGAAPRQWPTPRTTAPSSAPSSATPRETAVDVRTSRPPATTHAATSAVPSPVLARPAALVRPVPRPTPAPRPSEPRRTRRPSASARPTHHPSVPYQSPSAVPSGDFTVTPGRPWRPPRWHRPRPSRDHDHGHGSPTPDHRGPYHGQTPVPRKYHRARYRPCCTHHRSRHPGSGNPRFRDRAHRYAAPEPRSRQREHRPEARSDVHRWTRPHTEPVPAPAPRMRGGDPGTPADGGPRFPHRR